MAIVLLLGSAQLVPGEEPDDGAGTSDVTGPQQVEVLAVRTPERGTVTAVSVDEDDIVISGHGIPRAEGSWNANRTVYTVTIPDAAASHGIPGELLVVDGTFRSVRVYSGPSFESGRGVMVVAELRAPGSHTMSINPDATRIRIRFTSDRRDEQPDAGHARETVIAERTGYETLTLRYASADSLAAILRRLVTGGDRVIQTESRLNMLIIDRAMDRADDILDLIARLDRPGEQILIDAQIVELREDAASQLGLDISSSIGIRIGEDAGYARMIPFPLSTFLRSPFEIRATLDVLKGDGRAQILANPRVATVDGIAALVQTQERFPVMVTHTSGGQTYQTKQDIVGGISLSITPRHNGDGEITTVIKTDVTTITGTTREGYPTTSSRQVSTTVRVQTGQAIVIGGLLERRDIQHDGKIPLLGDIPLLGRLFTNRRTGTIETDLYVIITPYLIGGEE